jgi:hypothetical protein
MTNNNQQNNSNSIAILLFNLAIFITFSSLIFCSPATALLRQHHDSPNTLRYHAQDSLKDSLGNTWQVLLFPDTQESQTTKYYLRLVGFPGINSFIHPQSLEIITSEGKILMATDAYKKSAPAPNVGQYDLTQIIPQLPKQGSLKLAIPLQDDHDLSLKIAKPILTEWQLLTEEIKL